MRVIAGMARGCGLEAPKGVGTRPTADRLKENLFNLLQSYITDAVFLDLFSGSGAIGIEALSRGAREAYFVECAPEALRTIHQNLKKTRLTERAKVFPLHIEQALRQLARDGQTFDIIFMDPPYAGHEAAGTLKRLEQMPLLNPNGLLVMELPTDDAHSTITSSVFNIEKIKVYGITQFVFCRYTPLQNGGST